MLCLHSEGYEATAESLVTHVREWEQVQVQDGERISRGTRRCSPSTVLAGRVSAAPALRDARAGVAVA